MRGFTQVQPSQSSLFPLFCPCYSVVYSLCKTPVAFHDTKSKIPVPCQGLQGLAQSGPCLLLGANLLPLSPTGSASPVFLLFSNIPVTYDHYLQ